MRREEFLLGGFALASSTILEEHAPTANKDAERPPRLTTLECFRNCVGNQTDVWCLLFGEQYRKERELPVFPTCWNYIAPHRNCAQLDF